MNFIPSLGANPKAEDKRDLKPSDLSFAGIYAPIGECDYSSQPVLNQGQKGICTAIALTQMVEKMYGGNIRLSYAFLYKVGKRVYDQNTDEGSSLRTMLKVANNYGIPRYELAPYDINQNYADFMAMPDFSPEVYKDALNYTIGAYTAELIDKDSLAKAINKTPYGLYTRVIVRKNWYSSISGIITWAKEMINPLRPIDNGDLSGGGHAILIRGYDFTDENK